MLQCLNILPDIVFVSTWFQVAVPKLYNPVTSLLLAPEEKGSWTGMRTVGQLRHDANVPIPTNTDSQYKVNIITLYSGLCSTQT